MTRYHYGPYDPTGRYRLADVPRRAVGWPCTVLDVPGVIEAVGTRTVGDSTRPLLRVDTIDGAVTLTAADIWVRVHPLPRPSTATTRKASA